MPPACCNAIDRFFNSRIVNREMRKYHRSGPMRSSKKLIDALVAEGVEGLSLLDIGGGIGVIQHELFRRGIRSAVCVDASLEYLSAAQQESLQRGNRQRTSMYHGDFVDIASKILSADIVTLDRVLCCYRDVDSLISSSVSKTKRLYGLVYPREGILARLAVLLFNMTCWLTGNDFQSYYHSPERIRKLVSNAGLTKIFCTCTLFWAIEVYRHQA